MTTLDALAADYGVTAHEIRSATNYVLLDTRIDLSPGLVADVRAAWEQHVADVAADQADHEAVTVGAYDIESRTGDDEIDVSDESDDTPEPGRRVRVTFTRIGSDTNVPALTVEIPTSMVFGSRHVASRISVYAAQFTAATRVNVWIDEGAVTTGTFSALGIGLGEFTVDVVGPDVPVTFYHDEIGFRPGFVVGDCGHAVAGSEWRAGLRKCERC